MNLITEKGVADFVHKNNGILWTRDITNINQKNLSLCGPNTLVCITGYTQLLRVFFEQYIQHFTHPIKLIIIETDEYHLDAQWINHPKIIHIFGWNKPFLHSKVTALPIGLNCYRQWKIMANFLENEKMSEKTELLGINFSPHTNNIRKLLVDKAKGPWKDFCTFMPGFPCLNDYWRHSFIERQIRITETNPEYYKEISKFKFVLSPPGAGIDCHRTWEVLYLGCIPIVESSTINELYEDLPVLVVAKWDDISKEFLERKYEEIKIKREKGEYNMDKLYIQYWLNLIKSN
jgi:hypothetical protein